MSEIMECQCIAVLIRQLFQMLCNLLIILRNNEILIALMRNRLNQINQILGQSQLPGGFIGFIDFADNIVTANAQFASPNRQHIAFQIAKLQAAHFAHSQRQTKRQKTGQLNICTAHHLNDLLRCRQFFDLGLFRRQRDIQIDFYAIELHRRNNQFFRFVDGFSAHSQCIFIDCSLHCNAVELVNFNVHDALQAIPANHAVSVNCRRREYILLQRNVAIDRFSNCHPIRTGNILFCQLFRFPASRCC